MSTIAHNLNEARSATGEIRAGATDLGERVRHGVSPAEIVDISRLPELNRIDMLAGGGYIIGALVKIDAVAMEIGIVQHYPGLAMAAGSLATPQVRNAATLGGALLQRNRCWYFRHPEFDCFKKGGNTCPSREGNHQYGVCFDLGPCVSPHPSTLGMALMAYDAEVDIHGGKRMKVAGLYGDGSLAGNDHTLGAGEVLTHIRLPEPLVGEKSAYFRAISRARAEWPLVEVIVRYSVEGGVIRNAHVGIGGVANIPLRLPDVEAYLNGKAPGEAVFKEAGAIAARGANPLPMTAYKVGLIQGTVFETLRRAEAGIWGGEG